MVSAWKRSVSYSRAPASPSGVSDSERGSAVRVHRSEGEALEFQRRSGGVLEYERHLKERMAGESALGLQLFNEPLEGDVLVRVRLQSDLADPAKKLAKRGVSGRVGAQDESVGEEADESFELGAAATGDRRSDHDVFLPCVAGHQDREPREKCHEEGRTLFRSEAMKIPSQIERKTPPLARSPKTLRGRARPIRGDA